MNKITKDPGDFIVQLTSMVARQGRHGGDFITIRVHAARLSAVGNECPSNRLKMGQGSPSCFFYIRQQGFIELRL
jgi:hypothetical protein